MKTTMVATLLFILAVLVPLRSIGQSGTATATTTLAKVINQYNISPRYERPQPV